MLKEVFEFLHSMYVNKPITWVALTVIAMCLRERPQTSISNNSAQPQEVRVQYIHALECSDSNARRYL